VAMVYGSEGRGGASSGCGGLGGGGNGCGGVGKGGSGCAAWVGVATAAAAGRARPHRAGRCFEGDFLALVDVKSRARSTC
jgi:hypothetical protein